MPEFPKFRKISDFMNFVKNLEQREPITPEQLARDMELSEAKDYTVLSTIRGKGAISATLPDLSTIPPGMALAEAGMATVEGFGKAKITFERTFSDTPTVIAVPFGFFEITVPWVTVEWRRYEIGWWSISLPVPRVEHQTIRLPTMCFMMDVKEDGFEVFNVAGRTTVCYFAFGR